MGYSVCLLSGQIWSWWMDLHKGAWHFLLQQGLPIFSFLSASHQHLDNSASIVTQKTHQSLNQLLLMSQQWWDALMAGVVFECLKDSSDPDAIVVLEERTYSSKDLFNIHLPSAVKLSMLALLRHRGTGWVWPYSTLCIYVQYSSPSGKRVTKFPFCPVTSPCFVTWLLFTAEC